MKLEQFSHEIKNQTAWRKDVWDEELDQMGKEVQLPEKENVYTLMIGEPFFRVVVEIHQQIPTKDWPFERISINIVPAFPGMASANYPPAKSLEEAVKRVENILKDYNTRLFNQVHAITEILES